MNESLNAAAISLAESGKLPDFLLNIGIRRACSHRLSEIQSQYANDPIGELSKFIAELNTSEIAESTEEANQQHYELPPEFFAEVLGPRKKYSGCEWHSGATTLAEAEVVALETIVQRAQIEDGQTILELGCGWGSLSLFLAERFPTCEILAVSNSHGQRKYIESVCLRREFKNLTVVTADINVFEPGRVFDRIVTVEMLEHVRNYAALFARIEKWLDVDGKLFVHIFRHKEFAYLFETEGSQNWMGRHFFTGGVMPSHDLLMRVQDSLKIQDDWPVNGMNYALTSNAWLENMARNKERIMPILETAYGSEEASKWYQRWRMFFIACRELFGYSQGNEWGVSHYLFGRESDQAMGE